MSHLSWGSVGERGGGGKGVRYAAGHGVAGGFSHEGTKARSKEGAKGTACRRARHGEALRRAGAGYVEVVAGDTPAEVRRVVERLVRGN